MSDGHHPPLDPPADSSDLLDELGSLRELLDDEAPERRPITSVEQIETVEEYLRLKQEAEAAGISLEEYMLQQADEAPTDSAAAGSEPLEEVYLVEEEAILSDAYAEQPQEEFSEPAITLLEEQYAGDEAIPLLDEVVEMEEAVPLLDEVVELEEAPPILHEEVTAAAQPLDLDELQGLVELIVERKIEALRPALEKEVMEQLKRLLPIDLFQ